jgi:hypothetical protein
MRDIQGWPGHITRWEKSHGALKAIGGPQHHELFFTSAEILIFSVWAAALALYSSYLMTFFFWGLLEKNPTNPPLKTYDALTFKMSENAHS